MKIWIIPVCITFVLWGIQGFVAKLTTQYINPMSALLYSIVGMFIVGIVVLYLLNFSPQFHVKGIALAVFMGTLGILGALGMLYAMRQGKVSVVTVISALYPMVSILLAFFILREPITFKEGVGIAFALVALVLFAA